MITRGTVDITGFEQVLEKVINATGPLLDCKVLIDLQDAILRILPSDLSQFLVRFDFKRWSRQNKTALVSSSEGDQYKQLVVLGEGLLKMKVDVGLFHDDRDAVNRLSGLR